jgi:hypothetical protein
MKLTEKDKHCFVYIVEYRYNFLLSIKSQRSFYRLSIEQHRCPWLYTSNYLLFLFGRLIWERRKKGELLISLNEHNNNIWCPSSDIYVDVDGRSSIRTERSPTMAYMQTQSLFNGCWINELAVCLYVFFTFLDVLDFV